MGILGIWRHVPRDYSQMENFTAILPVNDNDEKEIKMICFDDESESVMELRGYVTEIAGERYMSLRLVGFLGEGPKIDPKIRHDYMFMHYSHGGDDEIVISGFKGDFFTKAIKEGLLKGEVEKIKTSRGYTDGDTRITAPTDEIVAFLRKHEKAEYLQEPDRFMRMTITTE
jgi:hypothetical protein